MEEFNFLAINQVSNFKQFEILEGQFLAQLSETDQTLESLDNKIVYLNKLLGALLDYQNELVPSQISLHLLETSKINKEMAPESLRKEIKELQIERSTLQEHRDRIVTDYDFANEMKQRYNANRKQSQTRL